MKHLNLLNKAFLNFNQAAIKLKDSYEKLQARVGELNSELEEKNRCLQASLRENEDIKNYLKSILESLPCGVIALDAEKNVLTFNRKAQSIIGISAEEMKGSFCAILTSRLGIPVRDVESFLNAKTISNFEARIKKDYSTAYISLNITALKNSKNNRNSVVVIQDITRLKRLEIQAQRNSKLIAIGKMAAKMAHEIRNPLGSIEIFASVLRKELSGESKKMADYICSAVKNLNHIVCNYLFFSRFPKARLKKMDIHKCLDDTINSIWFVKRDVKITKKYQASKHFINGDHELLKQASFNIILNSIQAIKTNGIITIETHNHFNEETWIEIKFIDNGEGISENDIDKIFDPFFTTKEKGTGLGLSIVHNIIDSHQGTIQVESTKGQGTAFSIMLPVFEE